MEIEFLGAAQEVTGSMHLVRTKHGSVLLDCGMFQGRREESRRRNAQLPIAALHADALVLSHAHIDHSGAIPTLVKAGFQGAIHTTPATRDLAGWMLRDAARIQVSDAQYLNRKHLDEPDWQPIVPLYDEEDAIKALAQMSSSPYGRSFPVLPGIRATFLDAGHILGSAEVMLEIEDGARTRRVLFSGDLGRRGMSILKDPEYPTLPIDYVLMESTYGNRVHGDIHSMHADLERVVKLTMARGGKLLIPAFSVGRTQEIVYALHYLRSVGRLPEVPVFIDSPLSVHVTEVFKLHPECYDEETRHFIEENGSLFDFTGLKYISAVQDSMKLNDLQGPAIIIASSGMCEAGRILHHLRNHIEDPTTTICIVGFQAMHTLGRRLVEKRSRVKIYGVERDLNARVVVMNAFSAHADKNELRDFARRAGKGAQRVFLVHGEPESQHELAHALTEDKLPVTIPALGDIVDLG